MKHVQSGSALILVVLVITIMTIYSTNMLYEVSLRQELVYKQEAYKKSLWLVHGLLNYACAVCMYHQDFLLQEPYRPLEFSMPYWPDKHSAYQGLIAITPHEKSFMVKAHLIHTTKTVCGISCLLKQELQYPQKASRLVRTAWTIEA